VVLVRDDGEKREMLSARVPSRLKALVNSDSDKNQDVVTQALREYYGGEKKALVDMEIEECKDTIERLQSAIGKRKELLQEEREELQRYEKRAARLEDASEEETKIYAQHVQFSERASSAGLIVETPDAQLEQLAEKAGVSVDELIAVAKEEYNA
jgi:hypothetical protein